tara:strand:+ start:939 stop:1781 length:843 start_codon:yes stop_codon:yes gene_type:complete
MIGFDHIGNLGRLGNQMFEFAALRGIAAEHGYEVCIPPADHQGIENYSLHQCFKLDHIKTGFINNENYSLEQTFHYNNDLFSTCPDNTSLYGFFQSWRYFVNFEDEIRKDFTFHDDILNPCKEMVESVEEPIMLHVRRGDPNLTDPRGFKWSYTQCSSQHPPQPIEYYEKALAEFPEDQPVIVFSDSIDWVKEQEFFSGDRFLHSEPDEKYADGSFTPYTDLCLMSLCSHAIIANSSMSWWGAWLQTNPNKKVIAPKMWFGPDYKDKDTSDLYYPNWIIL